MKTKYVKFDDVINLINNTGMQDSQVTILLKYYLELANNLEYIEVSD